MLTSLNENENIFVYVVLRAPLLTEEAWKAIRHFCNPETGCKDIKIVSHLLTQLIKRRIIKNYVNIAEICISLCTQVNHKNNNEKDKSWETTIIEMTSIYKKAPKALRDIIEKKYLNSWLDYLRDNRPPMKLVYSQDDMEWNEEIIIRILYYFLNIVPLNPDKLLMDLATIFANAASHDVQRYILRAIPMHIEKIGINSPAILNLIKYCPKNAEMLVIRIVNILRRFSIKMIIYKAPPEVRLLKCVS